MNRRKLQIFLSSTYEDLIDERLAAMEAILAAGHIPAAMEQFSPGDDTAWERIRRWIDESDAFILILGGRYGSIEPESSKSYVQLEYEYAIERKKPFFALVVSDKHHDQRVKQLGIDKADERERQGEYKAFKRTVAKRVSRFWSSRDDIQKAIFQKLPEWAERDDLIGWIRTNEASSPAAANELAELSRENRELRTQLASRSDEYYGLSFEHMVSSLRQELVSDNAMQVVDDQFAAVAGYHSVLGAPRNLGTVFDAIFVATGPGGFAVHKGDSIDALASRLEGYGLVTLRDTGSRTSHQVLLTDAGRRLRNRLAAIGDWESRRRELWSSDVPTSV